MAIAALKAGKHVLVEKPIARNTAEGKKMLAAAAKARKRLGVCFLQRWRPMIQTARSIVQAGCLGKLTSWVMVELGYKRESYWTGGYSQRAKTDWRLRWETAGGGYLIMNLIHNIDYLRYVSGLEVLKAKSMGGNYNSPPGVEVEDLIAGALSLSNGGIGIIAGASSVPGGRLGENRLVGTRGQIKFGTYGVETLEVYLTEAAQFDGHSVPAAEWTTLTCSADKADRSRTLMVESFGRWIHGEEEFLSPGRDALKSLAACEALYKSAGLVGGKA
jgi:predicted dehydrogenase